MASILADRGTGVDRCPHGPSLSVGQGRRRDLRSSRLSHQVERVCYRLVIRRGIGQGDWVKVFVTGATGVLGRAAVSALLHDGHEVTGLARSEAKAAELARPGADASRSPCSTRPASTEAFRGFDAVANLRHPHAGRRRRHPPRRLEGQRPAPRRRARRSSRRPRTTPAYAGWSRRASPSCTPTAGDEWITEDSTVVGHPGTRPGRGRGGERDGVRLQEPAAGRAPVRQLHRRRPDDHAGGSRRPGPAGRSGSATRRAGRTWCIRTTQAAPSPRRSTRPAGSTTSAPTRSAATT